MDPDQARHFVGPDLGTYCLLRLSADDTSRQRVDSKSFNDNCSRRQMYDKIISPNFHSFLKSLILYVNHSQIISIVIWLF